MSIGISVKPWALLCSQDVRSFTEVPSLDREAYTLVILADMAATERIYTVYPGETYLWENHP